MGGEKSGCSGSAGGWGRCRAVGTGLQWRARSGTGCEGVSVVLAVGWAVEVPVEVAVEGGVWWVVQPVAEVVVDHIGAA